MIPHSFIRSKAQIIRFFTFRVHFFSDAVLLFVLCKLLHIKSGIKTALFFDQWASKTCSPLFLFHFLIISCNIKPPSFHLTIQPELNVITVVVHVDIPERPLRVQQNQRAKVGSPFSHSAAHTSTHTNTHIHTKKGDVFHVLRLFVSLFWLLERGSECWH